MEWNCLGTVLDSSTCLVFCHSPTLADGLVLGAAFSSKLFSAGLGFRVQDFMFRMNASSFVSDDLHEPPGEGIE